MISQRSSCVRSANLYQQSAMTINTFGPRYRYMNRVHVLDPLDDFKIISNTREGLPNHIQYYLQMSILKLKVQKSKIMAEPLTMDSTLFRRRATKKRKSKWIPTSSLVSNESPFTPEPKRVRRTVSCTLRRSGKISSDSVALAALSIRLTDILTILCKRNDNNKATGTSKVVSAVVDHAMKTRFGKPETLVSALILLDRLQTSREGIRVTTHTVRVVYGMCVLLAGKFLMDESIWNYEAREMLGLSRGVNETEKRFLEILRWRVWIGEDEYLVYRSAVLG